MAQLSEAYREFLRKPFVASVATVSAEGEPQLSVVWIDVDGDDILFNTAEGRAKARNLHRNPAVAVLVVDPEDSYSVLSVRGRITEMAHEGADEHVDALAKKYTGADTFAGHSPAQQRVKVRIQVERVISEPEPADGAGGDGAGSGAAGSDPAGSDAAGASGASEA